VIGTVILRLKSTRLLGLEWLATAALDNGLGAAIRGSQPSSLRSWAMGIKKLSPLTVTTISQLAPCTRVQSKTDWCRYGLLPSCWNFQAMTERRAATARWQSCNRFSSSWSLHALFKTMSSFFSRRSQLPLPLLNEFRSRQKSSAMSFCFLLYGSGWAFLKEMRPKLLSNPQLYCRYGLIVYHRGAAHASAPHQTKNPMKNHGIERRLRARTSSSMEWQ
jgi:hypothetical protein